MKDFGLENYDFGFNFMKALLYAVVFYSIVSILYCILCVLKRIILQKTFGKLSKFLSNLMFFNYLIWFSLEAYLTLILSACLTLINHFEIKNSRRYLNAKEAFSFYGSFIFIILTVISLLFFIFFFIIKKTPKRLSHWISEFYDGLNEKKILGVVV